MVWDTCNVVLHSASNGIFFTNDIVTGSLLLEFKHQRKLEQLDFRVTGTSKAMWSRPSPTIPYIKIYSEKRKIFNVSLDLFQEFRGQTIQPGIISTQFYFIIPEDLPSTHKDSIAEVYYQIVIRSKSKLKFPKKIKFPFIVKNNANINHLEEYKLPIVQEVSKIFGNDSELKLIFKTYQGFSPQQRIPLEAIIICDNKRIKIKNITVALIQEIEYNVASGFYKKEKTSSKSKYLDLIDSANQTCYFHMDVPLIQPTTLNVSHPMIRCAYVLRVKVNLRCHSPLCLEIPVTISVSPVDHDTF